MKISAVFYPVSHWEEAKQFYGTVLGLEPTQCNDAEGWAAFGTTDGPPFFLVRRPDLVGLPGGACVTFECDDVEAMRRRVLEAGGQVDDQARGTPRVLTIYDYDGNRIELCQPSE